MLLVRCSLLSKLYADKTMDCGGDQKVRTDLILDDSVPDILCKLLTACASASFSLYPTALVRSKMDFDLSFIPSRDLG